MEKVPKGPDCLRYATVLSHNKITVFSLVTRLFGCCSFTGFNSLFLQITAFLLRLCVYYDEFFMLTG